MSNNPPIYFIWLGLVLIFGLETTVYGQSNYFKFPITQEGVYKISLPQAQELGAGSLDEIAVYGQGGMLPQKLDPADLQLKEIPGHKEGDFLYFYLEGPHQVHQTGDSLAYRHHVYADTLYYLIRTNTPNPPAKVLPYDAEQGTSSPSQWLYQIFTYKEDTHNLLSSGRKWYGSRIFSGESAQLDFHLSPWEEGPLYYQLNFMAQSRQENRMEVRLADELLENITIPAVPTTTYGIKGREKAISGQLPHFNLQNPANLHFSLVSGDPNAVAYLDYCLIGIPSSSQNLAEGIFYPLNDPGTWTFRTSDHLQAWDITAFHHPKSISLNAGAATVKNIEKLVIFNPQEVQEISSPLPTDISLRENSNGSNFIIITSPSLLGQANRLADHKNAVGISTVVVSTGEIYDAYGYGTRDITAIRNFLADQYHQYGALKHVLLFGKGTYDYKNQSAGSPNLVPTYSSRSSLNPLTTYSSDDYFGFLQVGEGDWEESEAGDHGLSIGVGRIPAINPLEAKNTVDKIILYESRSSQMGKWKRRLLFLADDGDQNIHLRHAESHAEHISDNHPEFEVKKLYLDNFEQINSGSSQSVPDAKDHLNQAIEEGVLLLNFIGHGNDNTLTAERIFQNRDIEDWPENNRFPLFVTATCEFGRHDSPFIRSGAEELLHAPNKGAIAMLTTGRPVFSSINFQLNEAFIQALFTQKDGQYLQLGEIFQLTKNNSLNGPFNRNFSLLGDPSLRLALPDLSAQLDRPYDLSLNMETDTVKAHQLLKIRGKVEDPVTQTAIQSFQGTFEMELLDKPSTAKTLGDENPIAIYQMENRVLHRGTGKIENGYFEADLYVPQNLDYSFGKGTLRFFASDEQQSMEAMKAYQITVGGSVDPTEDHEGPLIRLFAEDSTKQINTIPSSSMTLLARLEDESGIQVSPFNLGQNITLTINGENPIILNDYYRAINGSFRQGILSAEVNGLKEGKNSLSLTAFDNQGNNSTAHLEIEVRGSRKIQILEHQTYPNPSSAQSNFTIRHNRPGENIILQLRVYSLLGQEIISLEKRFPKATSVLTGMEWIFLRGKTKYPIKGTYIYKLDLRSEEDGSSDQASGKIHIQ